ncbi:MAG: type IV pilus secretin PilQ, partial [Candidatus Omnitrophica bacterium]|nr:type IV pilus secretin PilQ [Candidatus Omnitrophota bacterium]
MRSLICAAAFALVVAWTLPGQTQGQQAPPAPPAAGPVGGAGASVPAVPPALVVVVPSENGLVSLDFQDADIRNVLKVLSYKSGVNIVAGPEVTGVITIQLTDVPWQKALDVILATYGYGYDRKGNIITVTTIQNLKKRREDNQTLQDQEPLVTKTYSLNFAKASEVVESINKIKTGRGNINFDQRTNVLIVRDVAGNIELLDGVIRTLDSVTPQVLIEAKVVETTLSNTENLGITWAVGGTATGAQHSTSFPFTQETNKLIPSGATVSSNTFKYGTLDASGLSATLEMLHKRTDTNILSSPSIVTLDNNTAKIVIGSQYPIPQYTYNSDQAKLQLSGWNYMDIGIIFEVTPHVNNAGLVTLDLQPTITAITDYVLVDPAATAKVPVLSTEQAKTKVMILDGQTLVIAGLIKNKTSFTKRKVPLLGDIPVIGEIFRKKEDQTDKTELLIFLTPHIITAN